jgi:hypothetical protein
MERLALADHQVFARRTRVDAGPPEHLIGKHVADSSDEVLIHERGFDGSASLSKLFVKYGEGNAERVRPEWPDHLQHLRVVGTQPDPAQSPRVAIDETPTGKTDPKANKSTRSLLVVQPFESTGHSKVEDELTISGTRDQPLASSLLGDKGVPDKCTTCVFLAGIADHSSIWRFKSPNPPMQRVRPENLSIALNIRELGHVSLA